MVWPLCILFKKYFSYGGQYTILDYEFIQFDIEIKLIFLHGVRQFSTSGTEHHLYPVTYDVKITKHNVPLSTQL